MTWGTKYVILYGYKNRDLCRETLKVKEVDVRKVPDKVGYIAELTEAKYFKRN